EIKTAIDFPKQEVYQFLNKNQQKFTIGVQPVKKWDGFAALSDPSKASVKTLERLYQLTPSNEAMQALSKTGLTSALQITKYTKGEFMMKYGNTFSSTKEAELTFNKASEVQSAVMNLATSYLTARSAPNVYGITGKLQKEENEIIAYPTLEELFGNMDYCACDHCKSVLGAAAYLVDLLQFIDLEDMPHEKQNPIAVLLKRRPDIQHLQLTCENTNTILPYIDIVNEILEYYVINGNLDMFKGHDITSATKTTELLADPQFVMTAAYDEVKTKVYPFDLPFDYPLEALRLLFQAWDVTLPAALQTFRDPLSARKELVYLNEEEYKILTDTAAHSLPEYFGETATSTIDQLNAAISNGKTFSRRVNISYEDLVSLLKTEFINPGAVIVPLLEATKIPLLTLQGFYDGTITDAEMDALLPTDLVVADYGGDVKQWLRDNQDLIMSLITLTDIGPKTGECNFADVQLRFALPDNTQNKLDELAYQKFHRFIRLWKKTGWSIETTDKAIIALMPLAPGDLMMANINTTFVTVLARFANLKRVMDLLSLSDKKMQTLLLLWDNAKDPAFKLEQCAKLLKMRVPDMIDLSTITGIDPLADDMQQDEPSLLKFVQVAQALKKASLKIVDLNYLLRNKDESNKLIPSDKTLLKNIKAIRDSLNAVEKEHSITPDNADFAFAKSKMALVYDASVVNDFFGLITESKTYGVSFNTTEEGLPTKLTDADSRVGFDPFRKSLTYNGIITTPAKNALSGAADTLVLADMSIITTQPLLDAFKADFKAKLDALAVAGNDDLVAFGTNYPELKTVYDAVKAQAEPAAQTTTLLAGILPELKARLKAIALRQTLASILKAEPELINVLLDKKETLHATGDTAKKISVDFDQLEADVDAKQNKTYSLYLDAPATDDYIVYVKAPQNTVVTLTVNGVTVINTVTVDATGEVKNSVPLNLKAGDLYEAELTIASLPINESAQLLWRTKGMAKSKIPGGNLYIRENVDRAKTSLVRLQKSAMLIRLLKLTPVEVEYFAAQNTETKNFLNELDTDGTIADLDLQNLWKKLYLLLFFIGIKEETEQEENNWVQILQDPEVKNLQGKSLLLETMSWKKADVDAVLAHFAFVIADLSQLSKLKKVINAMIMVATVDYPATDIISWAIANPTVALINDIKQKIRDRTDDAAYLETM
ncbi:MAG TPA: Tc toxin subunit A, partial [Flavitalea sp.]|nr:Tc toxin subunit A [Flavitalea sp.]